MCPTTTRFARMLTRTTNPNPGNGRVSTSPSSYTPATARRYLYHVVPGKTRVDEAGLGRIFAEWMVDVGSSTFSAPTLIAAGRRDSIGEYADATELPGR